ncbi:MAG TPA: c-type cytochrome [Terriglobales bacterium]|nr:c-type cytochrome [Terriglobales bacterium]
MARKTLLLWGLLVAFAILAVAQKPVVKNVPAPQTSPASGKEMYVNYCASCHGVAGKGNGPAAVAFKVPPPDLTTLSRRNQAKFSAAHVYQVIKGDATMSAHGSKEMPVWGSVFSSMSKGDQAMVQLRISNLTKYIESLQVK